MSKIEVKLSEEEKALLYSTFISNSIDFKPKNNKVIEFIKRILFLKG